MIHWHEFWISGRFEHIWDLAYLHSVTCGEKMVQLNSKCSKQTYIIFGVSIYKQSLSAGQAYCKTSIFTETLKTHVNISEDRIQNKRNLMGYVWPVSE